MAQCKFCGREIEWITSQKDKPVPVDPDPVFVIEDGSLDTFLDDMGTAITGRQATPEEERRDLPVAFVPHWRTCPWADKPAKTMFNRRAIWSRSEQQKRRICAPPTLTKGAQRNEKTAV